MKKILVSRGAFVFIPQHSPLTFPVMTGFKEWTLICDALGRGQQSIILRKGGIAEGRDGFRFKHDEFLLFPTLFHEQVSKLKLPNTTPLPTPREDGQIEVRYRVQVEWTRDIADWEIVKRLAPFHLWQEAEIEKRFRQDENPAVSLAFVRAWQLSRPFLFPDAPAYGGCRSWVKLPDLPPDITATPVLDDAIHRERERQIVAVLGAE
jgi:hypothetical protein